MGNYKKNPDQPFEVTVPNKIRKRITMHERKRDEEIRLIQTILPPLLVGSAASKVRGSRWSRFTSGVARMFQIKPSGVRE